MKKFSAPKLPETLQAVWDALPTALRLGKIDGELYVYAARGQGLRPIRLTSLTQAEREAVLVGKEALEASKTADKAVKPSPQGQSKGKHL